MTVINSLVANDLYVDYVVKKESISALKGVSFHVKRGIPQDAFFWFMKLIVKLAEVDSL